MSYRIVAATPDDLPIIRGIARATWPATFGAILSAAQIEYMLERMYSIPALTEQLAQGHDFHLLWEGEEAVAYISHQIDYLPKTAKIHKIYILPDRQGRGYGRALINWVEVLALRAGQQKLRLDVNYQNRAVGFYEYLGFTKLDRFDTDIGNGYLMEDWRMEKVL